MFDVFRRRLCQNFDITPHLRFSNTSTCTITGNGGNATDWESNCRGAGRFNFSRTRVPAGRRCSKSIVQTQLGIMPPNLLILVGKIYIANRIIQDGAFRFKMLEERNNDLKEKCLGRALAITGLKQNIEAEENKVDNLRMEMELIEKMHVLKSTKLNSAHRKEVKSLEKRLKCSNMENTLLKQRIFEMEKQLNNGKKSVQEMKLIDDVRKQEVSRLNNRIDEIMEDKCYLEMRLSEKDSNLEVTRNVLQKTNEVRIGQILVNKSLQDDIRQLRSENENLKKDMTKIENENLNLQEIHDSLTAQYEYIAQENYYLIGHDKLTALTDSTIFMEESTTQFEGGNSGNNQCIYELQKHNSDLNNICCTLEQEICTIRAGNESLKYEMELMNNTLNGLEDGNLNLENENDVLKLENEYYRSEVYLCEAAALSTHSPFEGCFEYMKCSDCLKTESDFIQLENELEDHTMEHEMSCRLHELGICNDRAAYEALEHALDKMVGSKNELSSMLKVERSISIQKEVEVSQQHIIQKKLTRDLESHLAYAEKMSKLIATIHNASHEQLWNSSNFNVDALQNYYGACSSTMDSTYHTRRYRADVVYLCDVMKRFIYMFNTLKDRNNSLSKEVWRLLQKQVQSLQQEKILQHSKKRDELRERIEKVKLEREKLFEKMQDVQGNVRVFCRIKPSTTSTTIFSKEEIMNNNGSVIEYNSKKYRFNRVIPPQTSQAEVYSETSGAVQSVLNGRNVCIFAYGQTGSGKTFTMQGTDADPGVNVRAVQDLFRLVEDRGSRFKFIVSFSMFEIYNNRILDLLTQSSTRNGKAVRGGLQFTEIKKPNGDMVVTVQNLSKVTVKDAAHTLKLLTYGQRRRASATTAMNSSSSRSHLLVKLSVTVEDRRNGSSQNADLHLIDLAGSERLSKSQVTQNRRIEAIEINLSLSTLALVFEQLANNFRVVSYRNSKLTRYLQSRIGNKSISLMFLNVSNDNFNEMETAHTLRFGERVAKIKLNKQSARDAKEIARIQQTIRSLDREIVSIKALFEH